MLGEIWKIGDWSVFPAENTLRRDGSEVKVPPRLILQVVKRSLKAQKRSRHFS